MTEVVVDQVVGQGRYNVAYEGCQEEDRNDRVADVVVCFNLFVGVSYDADSFRVGIL